MSRARTKTRARTATAPRLESLEEREVPAVVGTLDASFGSAGTAIAAFDLGGLNRDEAAHAAIQPDGKIVVVGFAQSVATDYDFAIARFNPDGTLDTTFSGDGLQTIAFNLGSGQSDEAGNVVLQPDGKIVVVGSVQRTNTDYDFGIARLLTNGDPDNSFDGDGKRTVAFDNGGGNDDKATSVALQADGKIVVGGFAQFGATDYDFAAVRLLSNGDMDTSFDGDGKRIVPFDLGGGNNDDKAYGLVIQPDGKVVLGGFAQIGATDYDFAAARLLPDGTPDTSFDGDGKRTVAFDLGGGKADRANDIDLQPDGKIVLAGWAQIGATDYDFAAVRLLPDGTPDTSFDGDGKRTVAFDLGGGNDDRAADLDIQPDGRFVLAGAVQSATDVLVGVARLLPDGTLDASFGGGGKRTVVFDLGGGNDDRANGVLVQANGRIVIVGRTKAVGLDYNFGVARLIGSVEKGTRLAVGGSADGRAQVFSPNTATGQYGNTPASTPTTVFPGFAGAVRTAVADVNGDFLPDTVLVTGPGTPLRLAVVSGADNSTLLVAPFDPFGGDFTGGGFVAAADVDHDGRAELAVTPDQGGGPRVTIFSRNIDGTLATRANFFGIDDANFRGGCRAAFGDVDGDGTADLAVAAGFLGGPRAALFDGETLTTTPTRLVGDFFAFPGTDATNLRNGAYVAAGDVDGDGKADLIFGGGPDGAPRVFVLGGALVAANNVAGAQAAPVANFYVAGNTTDRGGVRVAAADADGDGRAEVVTGSGGGSPSRVRVYLGKSFSSPAEPAAFQDLDSYGGAVLAGGVYVG